MKVIPNYSTEMREDKKMNLLIFFIPAIFIIIIIMFDFLFSFNLWQSRIHIGKWNKKEKWEKKVVEKIKKWLIKTPTVKKKDNNKYVFFDIIKREYKSKNIQSWQEGGILLGAVNYLKINEDIKLKRSVYKFIEKKVGFNNKLKIQPKEVDEALLAYAILKFDIENRFDDIYHKTKEMIFLKIAQDETICYRDEMPEIRFVDTIGFVCPFLMAYGVKYDDKKCIELSLNQINDFFENSILKNCSLVPHAYNIKSKIPLGVYDWGRGNGWFLLGIIESYRELPNQHFEKNILKEKILKIADDFLVFQHEDGGFGCFLTNKNSYDSSITAIAGYFYICCYEYFHNNKYKIIAEKCSVKLMKVTRRTGEIDFCQGDTKGIGIYSLVFDKMPFVQGIALSLYSKIFDQLNY